MMIKITECPRDAMQGIKKFIPTEKKTRYLNLLLKVGFDRLDFGSFVSHNAIPQMRDTAQLVDHLEKEHSSSTLLAIVANVRGAEEAAQHKNIGILGFPLSVSETFQQRNTNKSIEHAFKTIAELLSICQEYEKIPLIYLSMGFGNPYGDIWGEDIVADYTEKLISLGITEIMLADTIGVSTPEKISSLFPLLKNSFPNASIGLHLHSKPDETNEKLEAALETGCTRFDTALRGFGGCPMAKDELIGNIATENLISLLERKNCEHSIDKNAWREALAYSDEIFNAAIPGFKHL